MRPPARPTARRPVQPRPGAGRPAVRRPVEPRSTETKQAGETPDPSRTAAGGAAAGRSAGKQGGAEKGGAKQGAAQRGPGRAGARTAAGSLLPTQRVIPVRPPVVSTVSAARFAERARAQRRLSRTKALGGAGVLALVLGAGWLAWLSPVFALDPEQVQVVGAGTVVDVAQVKDVVARQGAGVPLPRLDAGDLRAELLEVPGVRAAEVHRAWPQGLVVTLVSREPVAAVPDEGTFALLDIDGVQVGRVDAAPADLPQVTIPVELGEQVDGGAAPSDRTTRTLRSVLAVLDELPEDLVLEVAAVSAGSPDTVSMELRDGRRVEWGSGQDTALKAAVLRALQASPQTAAATVFDVSAPTTPITRS